MSVQQEWLQQRKTLFKKLADQELSLSDFQLKNTSLISQLTPENLIGGGAVGKVYAIGDVVVKQVLPCLADPDKPLYQYCSAFLEDRFYLIPGGRGKFRYILPNLLSEIVVGMIVSVRFPDSYGKTLAGLLVQEGQEISVYIIMERLNVIRPEDYSSKDVTLLVYQVAVALLEAQTSYKFTHYDLHIENILTQTNFSELSYPVPNRDNYLTIRPDQKVQISDFALARLETNEIIISPEVDKFPIKSYGEFSPGYDILCFLGSLIIDSKYSKKWEPVYRKNPDLYKFLVRLLQWILPDNDIYSEDLSLAVQQIAERYYTRLPGRNVNRFTFRPVSDQLFVNYTNTKSMSEIVDLLSKVLLEKRWAVSSRSPKKTVYPEFPKIVKFLPSLDFSEIPELGRSLYRYQEMFIAAGVSARAYHIKTKFPANIYNFTLSEKQIQDCPIQEHYLNTVYIQKDALQKYQWKLDCCKLDLVNYVAETDKPGFAINGGFFNINQEFLPIGVYEDDFVYIDKYEIPEDYRDVFGEVILSENRLKIQPYTGQEQQQSFATGPILIRQGEIVFNPNQLRYICTDEKNSSGIVISQTDKTITTRGYYKYRVLNDTCEKQFVPNVKTYRRCDKIQPGELSHADNPNPRSALCILDNGDYVVITAEGRGRRGVGFDLYTLALTIKQNYPNTVSAVNLDGGRSSILAWRSQNDPDTVYVSNYDRDYVYPVGNILTFFQK